MLEAKRGFESRLADNIKNDKKSFFAYVRSKSKSRVNIGSVRGSDGALIDNRQLISEEFNKFFSSVFTEEDMKTIPEPHMFFRGSGIDSVSIEVEEVRKRLGLLKEGKASGPDGLSPRMLKLVQNEMAYPVTLIFRKSISESVVPKDWKLGNVSPLFKKGTRSDVGNYRPVSLTSQICKIMEGIIRDRIVEFLDSNNLISSSQHGFRRGRSCLTNLLSFLNYVTECMDHHHSFDVIFLDMAKAFDKVPHARLVMKLKAHGVDGKILDWIEEWLKDRKQRVCLNGVGSSWRAVSSGVPQGSALGPLLFLIFINDLGLDMGSMLMLFADDAKLGRVVNNEEDANCLQNDLDSAVGWTRVWQMLFNPEKCVVMYIGVKNNHFSYYIDGKKLRQVKTEKDLGVTLSNDLKVANQCVQACNAANRALGMISRTIQFRDSKTLLQLYKSLVRPCLEYCSPKWSPYYVKDRQLIEKVQRRSTKLFPDQKGMSYRDRLDRLGLWMLEERRNRADLIEVFKMMRGISSVSPDEFFVTAAVRSTRGHSMKLVKPHCEGIIRQNFFSLRVINRWNALPEETVSVRTVNAFKNELCRLRKNRMGFFLDS